MLRSHCSWVERLKILKSQVFICLRWAFRVVLFSYVSFLSASSDSLHHGPWRHFFADNNPAQGSGDTSIAGQGFQNIFRIVKRLSYESVMLNYDTSSERPIGVAEQPANEEIDK